MYAIRRPEAVMEGCEVLPMAEASRIGDLSLTGTGKIHGVEEHFRTVKDGAPVAKGATSTSSST
jgi:adenosylhomocysteinase